MATSCFFSYSQISYESESGEAFVKNQILAVTGADLDISPIKISKTVTWTLNFLSPLSIDQRKINLINDLCKEAGADILIDAQFTYKKRILGGGKMTVTGYPAKYRNFRSLTQTEIDSLILRKDTLQEKVIFFNR